MEATSLRLLPGQCQGQAQTCPSQHLCTSLLPCPLLWLWEWAEGKERQQALGGTEGQGNADLSRSHVQVQRVRAGCGISCASTPGCLWLIRPACFRAGDAGCHKKPPEEGIGKEVAKARPPPIDGGRPGPVPTPGNGGRHHIVDGVLHLGSGKGQVWEPKYVEQGLENSISRAATPNTYLALPDKASWHLIQDPVFHFPLRLVPLLCWCYKHTHITGMGCRPVTVQCSSTQSHRLNSCIHFLIHLYIRQTFEGLLWSRCQR